MHPQMHRAVVAVVAVAEEVVAVAEGVVVVAEGVVEVVVAAPKDRLAVVSRHSSSSLVAEVGSRMGRMGATGRSMGNPGDLRGAKVGKGVGLRQAKRAGAREGAEGHQSKILDVI